MIGGPRCARRLCRAWRGSICWSAGSLQTVSHSHSSVPPLAVCPKSIEVLSVVAFHRFAVAFWGAAVAAGGGGAPARQRKTRQQQQTRLLACPSVRPCVRASFNNPPRPLYSQRCNGGNRGEGALSIAGSQCGCQRPTDSPRNRSIGRPAWPGRSGVE